MQESQLAEKIFTPEFIRRIRDDIFPNEETYVDGKTMLAALDAIEQLRAELQFVLRQREMETTSSVQTIEALDNQCSAYDNEIRALRTELQAARLLIAHLSEEAERLNITVEDEHGWRSIHVAQYVAEAREWLKQHDTPPSPTPSPTDHGAS